MVIKNYKQLCQILEQPVKFNNSKLAQLKEFTRYFSYEKQGQKIIITEIFDNPKAKQDGRYKGNRSIFTDDIAYVLLEHIHRTNKHTFTLNELYSLLGFVNERYHSLEHYTKLGKEHNSQSIEELPDTVVTVFDVKDFYRRATQKMYRLLYTTLDNLQKRNLISYDKKKVFVYKDANDNSVSKKCSTNQELKILNDVKTRVLAEMNFSSEQEIYGKFKYIEFYSKIIKYLREMYDLDYFYTEILIDPRVNLNANTLSEALCNQHRENTNTNLITSLNEQMEKRHIINKSNYDESFRIAYENEKNNTAFGEVNENMINCQCFNPSDTYVDAQKEIAEYLLKL